MARLQVDIDGNASGLTSSLNQANNSLNNFSKEANKVSNQTQNFTKSVGNANGVAMEFNRIIQDAPFGMIGIGNNLQQLVSNYQSYTQSARAAAAQTGQTVTSFTLLKGALSSILSPINLLTLGVAAATSAWTLYERSTQKSNKETKEAEENVKILGNSYSVLNASLNDDKGLKNAISSISNLKINVDLANKGIISQDDVLKQYNKTLGDSAGRLKTFSEVEDFIINKSDAYIKAMMLRAAANTALEEAAKAAVQAQKLAIEPPKQEVKKIADNSQATQFLNNQGIAIQQAGSFVRGKLQEDAKKTEKTFTNIAKEFQKQIAEINKEFNFNLFGGGSDYGGNSSSLNKNFDIIRDGLNYFDQKLYDIDKKYKEIYENVKDKDLLGLAQSNEEAEKLRVNMEKLLYVNGKLSGAGVTINTQLQSTKKLPTSSGLTNSFAGWKAGLTAISSNKEDKNLENRLGKVVESGFRRGISSVLDNIDNLGTNFYEVFSNTFKILSNNISSIFNDVLATQLGNQLTKMFESQDLNIGKLSNNVSKAIVAGAGIAGGLVSSMSSKTSSVGQGIGGALSGAAAGMAFGPWGAAIGGVIGGIAGLFGAKAARKQEELQKKQLEEQKKQTKLMEYQNAKGWESSIIGQMTNQGFINGFSRSATGQLVARISGRDLLFLMEREQKLR